MSSGKMIAEVTPYSQNDHKAIRDIIEKSMGRKNINDHGQLAQKLESLAVELIFNNAAQGQATHWKLAKRLAEIEKQANRLLKLIGNADMAHLVQPALQRGEAKDGRHGIVAQTILGLSALKHFADDAAVDAISLATRNHANHHGNQANRDFVHKLGKLWECYTDKKPGTQKNSPFAKFAVACYKPLQKRFPLVYLRDLKFSTVRDYLKNH